VTDSTTSNRRLCNRLPCATWLIMILSLCFALADAQAQIDIGAVNIASSPNVVGSGARAMGMGGAFVAVADDATAASWNPAALLNLELPEASVVGSAFWREEDYSSLSHPEVNGATSAKSFDLNYLSVAYPFTVWQRNMVGSLNVQRLMDFHRRLDFDYNISETFPSGAAFSANQKVRFRQKGGLSTISPAFGLQIAPRLSVGVTVNMWTDEFGLESDWSSRQTQTGSGTFSFDTTDIDFDFNVLRYERYRDLEGYNATVGVLWNATDKLTLGAVVDTPFRAKLKRRFFHRSEISYNGTPDIDTYERRERVHLEFPLSYAVGAAYQFNDFFKMSLDVTRTEWDDFVLTDVRDTPDQPARDISAVTGLEEDKSHVKATHTVRLGAEHLFVRKNIWALRGGMFYDPEPAQGNAEDFYGLSVGTGFTYRRPDGQGDLREVLSLDWAYQYRFGLDVEGDVLGMPDSDADVDQHLLLASLIFYF